MKRIILILFFSVASFLSFAETYKVSNTIGKVYAQTSGGKWKRLKEDSTITEETVIRIEDKASIGFIAGTKKITIRGPKENTLEALITYKRISSGSIKKTKINKGSVASSSAKSTKGANSAATRASEAQDNTNWEEE